MRGARELRPWLASVVAMFLVVAMAGSSASEPRLGAIPSVQRAPGLSAVRSASVHSMFERLAGLAAAQTVDAEEATRRRFRPHLLVHVPHPLVARAHPGDRARAVGTVVSSSKYYHVPMVLWVERVARGGTWGLVEIPYSWPRREGWIRLAGLRRATTAVEVRVDLSRRRVTVFKRDRAVASFPGAIGTSVSPTPPGEYAVTDRIPFSGGYLGSFAFGISGIQPDLPPGWSGGNQLAIHGTNDPSSIGTRASAGCVRVSEAALARLRPLLQLGTPVVITP